MMLPQRALEPIERISEVLFGLIMVLSATGALSVANSGRPEIKTMILGALGCNLAWGIIDGGLYLLGRLEERGRNLMTSRLVKQAAEPAAARRAIADALPEPITASLAPEDLDLIAHKLSQFSEVPKHPGLTAEDWLGAASVCVWVFFSTIPVVIPFFFTEDVRLALRLSNTVAIAMLFVCGYAFGRIAGLSPWLTGLVMVFLGVALSGVAILLGG
jgi:VIT1/CCC1 family predicted Fe2+/Mn2+ transporter